jgi:hypothetical protein
VEETSKLDDFLAHYKSQYYDPVKAHEYYMRNRQLKGRTTSGMSEEQKEVWAVSKSQISTEKKSKVEGEQTLRDQRIENFRAKAEATRKRISDKLKLLSEQLSDKASADRDSIEARRQAELDSLGEIPKGISAEERAKLVEERKKKVAKILGDARKDKSDISKTTKTERSLNSDNASAEREKTRTELKSSINNVRETYKKAKADLDTKYEGIYQKEYDKILTTVPGKKSKKGR